MLPTRARTVAVVVPAICFAFVACGKDKPSDSSGGAQVAASQRVAINSAAPSMTAPPRSHIVLAHPESSTSAAPSAAPSAEAFAVGPDPVVKLVSAGAEPKAVLRIKAPAGAKQKAELTMSMAMTMKIDGNAPPSPPLMPPMHLTMTVALAEIKPDGTRKIDFAIDGTRVDDDAKVPKQMLEGIRASMASIEGMKGSVVMTDRGFNRGFSAEAPKGTGPAVNATLDSFRQSMAALAAPLPEEAVGVGAKWTVTKSPKHNGMTIDQTETYELIARKGDVITVKVSLTQTAAPQDVVLPTLPPGAKASLTKLLSSGSGEQTLDLTGLVPKKMTAKIASDSAMTMSMQGKTQSIEVHTAVDTSLESR